MQDPNPSSSLCDRPLKGACPVAYLISQYPKLSMVFILREVVQLRRMGFRIDVASINRPDRSPDGLTELEQAEAARTYYVKRHGVRGAAAALLISLTRNFRGFWRGFGLAWRLGGLDLKRLLLNFGYFTEALMVGVWMRRVGQRHLHAHLGGPSATVGMYVKRVFQYGFSITVHGPDEFFDARGQYLLQKVEAADFICCISSYGRSQLMRVSPYAHWAKLLVVRLGVDPDQFSPRPQRTAPECFEILCVGRLTPAKGQHLLIDAVARLRQQGHSVRVRLVGAGDDEPGLREHAARIPQPESIVFEGGVNPDQIRKLYESADIFCLPSFAEGIPVALMEAMAMEIPCVSTTVAGIPELIRDGVDGLLVAPSDLDGLVEALSKLIDNAALRAEVAKSGRVCVLKHYDLNHNVEKLAAVFADRL